MACKCIETVNSKLAERNTKLTESIVLREGSMDLTLLIETEILDRSKKKRGDRPLLCQPTFCPFCGTAYVEDKSQEAINAQIADDLRFKYTNVL